MKLIVTFRRIVGAMLLVSFAASAALSCACSHHLHTIEAVSGTSCHGVAHEEAAKVTAEETQVGDCVEPGCVCFTRDPVATAFNKSKKADKAKAKHVAAATSGVYLAAKTVKTPQIIPESGQDIIYEHLFRFRRPARAPPRL